ncbi:protein FAM117B isoform X2 [Exaiptasia diaphana]|uniref:Glucocorticoid-induced transcript 1 protein n=1 Tax=Exaiptasia diaphana TaxID=2652724 RepID=A0A913XCC2_EXADI|nr:protein FAM117B isoform X2 [Exaiptasia diaphana]
MYFNPRGVTAQEMASQPPRRRNVSPAASSSKPQPLRAVHPFSLLRNPSPTRGNQIRKSPTSSPIHNVEKTRCSPDHSRRSPTSPSLAKQVERPKPLRAGGVRRTSSLDAISGTYLCGQWPRDGGSCRPCCHKATQTPAWDDKEECSPSRHKRSNSLGSADLREKLKQQLRKKQDKKITAVYGRQSPVHGDHSAINKNTQSIAIPIPVLSRPTDFPQRKSWEACNSEIQTLDLKPRDQSHDKILEPMDGRKAPPPEILSENSPFSTVDIHTQTPSETHDFQDSSGNSSSRSHSASPTLPIIPGAVDYQSSSRCSSGTGAPIYTPNEQDSSPEPSAVSKFASSPKPNNSYLFAREPPDGAEKVQSHVEDIISDGEQKFTGPDKTKVMFMLSNASAFSALPSLPEMAMKPVLVTSHTLEASGQ